MVGDVAGEDDQAGLRRFEVRAERVGERGVEVGAEACEAGRADVVHERGDADLAVVEVDEAGEPVPIGHLQKEEVLRHFVAALGQAVSRRRVGREDLV